MDVPGILRRVIVENELGGDLSLAYKFSDPDGVRSGKSGYSFGRCQFDLQNNQAARNCLLSCGFSLSDTMTLINQTATNRLMRAYDAKLQESAHEVDRWDEIELANIARHVRAVLVATGIKLFDGGTFVHLCDYHNQYFLDYAGRCVRHLLKLSGRITPANILDYKLTTAWGKKRPDDVRRRFNNIVMITNESRWSHHERIDEICERHAKGEG